MKNTQFCALSDVIPAQAGIHTPQLCGLRHDDQVTGTCWQNGQTDSFVVMDPRLRGDDK